ncbi:hypothetical protein B8V81_3881 [Paenibacillus pasadenensis]|uniref:Uncharacterized protein n=1 Tax=Paenibacillus pasadenensis TaxID=217090 RepID=A0A2N5N571_9BACL|nr:hypothetical protein [Paenibacillus pasadenensis]PLT45450.1 hypothetical protein B8V81_3881 [Paenibacillus pasadenensis]
MAQSSLRAAAAALLAMMLGALPAAAVAAAAPPLSLAVSKAPSRYASSDKAPAEDAFRSRLQAQAASWRDELARLPEFAAWKSAELRLEPLGPGTHAWLAGVFAADSGEQAGYMILNAKEDGSVELGEYGAGESPLFRESALRQGLKKEGKSFADFTARKRYASPFAAVWRLQDGQGRVRYADAASGELLPISDADWSRWANDAARPASGQAAALHAATSQKPASATKPVHLASHRLFAGDDPLQRLSWLLQRPLSAPTEAQLLQRLQAGTALDYAAEAYGGKALFIGQAAGFHRWSGAPAFGAFRMAGSAGIRYLPLVDAAAAGSFYPVGDVATA